MSEHHLSSTQFTSLSLRDELLKGLDEAGFEYCTPIQEASLPIALESRDVAGQAQTGTGKTAAFLLATFQHLLNTPADERRRTSPRAMILAPTRELAIQIYKDAEVFGKHTGLSMGVVYGGTGYEQQKQMLADGLDIVIGTPGRLIDYYKQKIYGLKDIQVMVLDEADRMFDLGFIKDIRYLLRRMPPPEQRLGLLYSATLSYRVTELAYEHMNNPELVKIEADSVTADKVKQIAYFTANEEKIPLLIGLLKGFDDHRSIIFVNTKRAADRVWGYLEGNGLSTAVLSGDVPQKKRQALLNRFQSGELSILVATDVAARGLHIPEVTHVINYDLPQDAEDYVHRIGRTARAGATGDAISFVCEDYAFSMPEIEDYIGQKVPMEALDEEQLAEVEPPKKRERRPRDDKRSNSRSGRGRQRRPYPQNGDGQNKAEGEKPKQQADKPADSEGEDAPKKRRRRRRRKPSGEAQGQNGQQTQTQTAKPDSPSES